MSFPIRVRFAPPGRGGGGTAGGRGGKNPTSLVGQKPRDYKLCNKVGNLESIAKEIVPPILRHLGGEVVGVGDLEVKEKRRGGRLTL